MRRAWRCRICGRDLGEQAYHVPGTRRLCCPDCWATPQVQAAAAEARRRRAEWEASRPRCERCGRRPATWTVGREAYQLCGRCKTRTLREAYGRMGTAGGMLAAMGGSSPIATRDWTNLQPREENTR